MMIESGKSLFNHGNVDALFVKMDQVLPSRCCNISLILIKIPTCSLSHTKSMDFAATMKMDNCNFNMPLCKQYMTNSHKQGVNISIVEYAFH